MEKLDFHVKRVGNILLVLGVKLPEEAFYHVFPPSQQNLRAHPKPVQIFYEKVKRETRKSITLDKNYFSLYYKNNKFVFKDIDLESGNYISGKI